MSLLQRLSRFFKRVPQSVSFDDEKVVRTRRNGQTESVRWADLSRVSVITTGDGPWSEDVFLVLEGTEGGCAVPQGAAGSNLLLTRLQALPGFNNQAFINAMGCASNERFICWERAS